MRIFADKGFAAASLREIAGAANVDVALIAYRFGSKLGLWKSTVEELARRYLAGLEEARGRSGDTGPDARLRAAMLACIDFMLDHPDVPRFLLRDAGRDAAHSQWVFEKLSQPFVERLVPLMNAARAAGRFGVVCPELAAMHFGYGVAVLIARRQRAADLSPALSDREAFRAALCDTLVEPLFRHG